MAHNVNMGHFGESIKGTLCILWNYIRAVLDLDTRHQLKESMAAKLIEIHAESPCSTGMIERIIDIPTAIDWSITQKMSVQHLRDELQRMAGAVNESCDADPDINFLVDQATAIKFSAEEVKDKGPTEALTMLEKEITTLKRNRFLHTAQIELFTLRGIDSKLVKTVAESIFPEHVSI